MRLFLAIELPSHVLDDLESALAPLRAAAPGLAWVPCEKRHLTLKFLGDVAEDRVPALVAMMDRVARPFGVRVWVRVGVRVGVRVPTVFPARRLEITHDSDPDTDPARRITITRDSDPYSGFDMQLQGIGAFPNFRRARVVWIGVEQEARLELLHHDLEVACEQEGFEIDGRAFRPHVTLARIREPLDLDGAKRLARAARRIDFAAVAAVSEISLLESTLAPDGARYRRLHTAPLG